MLVVYNFAAFWSWKLTGVATPEWFLFGDILAALTIAMLAEHNRRNALIVIGYAGCIFLYDMTIAFEATRWISIVQFMLCWPLFASEWNGPLFKWFPSLPNFGPREATA